MATMEARIGSLPQGYPSVPASPTLTNPDMILPDYDGASLGLDDEMDPVRSQSPLMMWKNAHAATSSTDLQQLFSGVATGPVTPTTPIIYGNGTMLSDIGEVTEAESTVGKPSPGSVRRRVVSTAVDESTGSRTPSPTPLPHQFRHPYIRNTINRPVLPADPPRASSPTMGRDDTENAAIGIGSGTKQRARQQAQERMRHDSIDSNSTITTTQEHPGLFADFDDSVSVDDSVFQGDDEESVAESYVNEPALPLREVHAVLPPRDVHSGLAVSSSSLLSVPDLAAGSGLSDDEGRRHSTASISRRAEQILANAKKRLTTMEDNLTRARSSLYVVSPVATSIPSDGSTPSPKLPMRSATALADNRVYDPSFPQGHTRLGSDGSTSGGSAPTAPSSRQRSASAMGAAGGYRQPKLSGLASVEQMHENLGSGYVRASHVKPVDITLLEPLSEDEVLEDHHAEPAEQDHTIAHTDSLLSPTFGTSADKGLTRSASVAQMRDLRDHMKDLKGKISSLREQARADSMKRRSLQSLRTPSPFTHSQVDQWYAEPKLRQEPLPIGKPIPGRNPWNGELSTVDGEQENGERLVLSVRSGPTPTPSAGEFQAAQSSGSQSSGTIGKITPLSLEDTEPPVLELEQETIPASADADITGANDMEDMETEKGSDDGEMEDGGPEPELEQGLEQELEQDLGPEPEPEQKPEPFPQLADEEAIDDRDEFDEEEEEGEEGRDTPDAGYESEGGESLYHDTVQHQISHEDREDAFDYEHFILHSALGTISQQRLTQRGRSDSYSSEDSVATARGPIIESTIPNPGRRGSVSSISTVESFATATEGRSSRTNRSSVDSADGDEEEYLDTIIIRPESAQTAKSITGPFPGSFPSNTSSAHSTGATVPHTAASRPATSSSAAVDKTKRNSAEEPRQTQQPVIARRPASSAAWMTHRPGHRPSASSFESMGTTRSFPLVNRSKLFGAGANSRTNTPTQSVISSVLPPPSSQVSSDNEELKSISETLLNETASIYEQQAAETAYDMASRRSLDSQTTPTSPTSPTSPISPSSGDGFSNLMGRSSSSSLSNKQSLQMLGKEDQYRVERLVGSLGRCVLGLTENGRASPQSRVFRRRIDAARRILEGLDAV